jgi:kumamolisin
MSALRGAWQLSCALAVLLMASRADAAAGEPLRRLEGNIAPVVRRAAVVERMQASERLRFSLALGLPNPAALDDFLARVYTPGDPLYHQFLKTGEFAERFGPSQADYDAVVAFVKSQGLNVVATHSNRMLVEVEGSVDKVEAALGLRLMHYRSEQGRVFHAPDAEPSLPASIAAKVSGIVGLDNALEPRSNLRLPNGAAAGTSGIGTGPGQGLSPANIKTAYNLTGVSENGSGQVIALFELDGYLAGDIRSYETNFGLPNVTLENVLLNGASGAPSALTNSGPVEVTLDIELALALAPGASKIQVYIGTSFADIYNRIASDNTAQQVSTSWYPSGIDSDISSSLRNTENTAFKQMAAQGQTFYAASGDFGDNVKTGTDKNGNAILKFGVQDPSSQQYVTGVGGTTLNTVVAGGAYFQETAWSGGGGGISAVWSLPNYQSQAVSSGSSGSSTSRNVPDVSLNSDPNTGYSMFYNGSWSIIGGTSCAAPLWAAFNACVNQRRAGLGAGRLGFLNPTLYYLAQSPYYSTNFHDITNGNNGTYAAVSGYDNVTGWGSLNGAKLISDLQENADVLYVDGGYGGSTQNGTVTQPFKTVSGAVNAASSAHATLIYIRGNTYLESANYTINKKVLLINNGGGTVTIN